MTIKVSAYDFFSYTVPGSLYIFTIVYILKIIGYVNLDFSNFDPSLIQTIIIIGVAYVIGYIFEPIAKVWSILFRPKDFHANIINEFKYKHPNVEIKFLASDWPILLAFIRQNNDEIVGNIEKDNATNLMLRGISLCFIVLSIIQIVQFFYGLFLPHIIIAIVLIISSIIIGKQGMKFYKLYFFQIFEMIVAKNLEISKIVDFKEEDASGKIDKKKSKKNDL